MFTANPFYHSTIRSVTVAFGTMFNDLKINRDDKVIPVPIRTAPSSGWFTRLSTPLEGKEDEAEKQVILPQLAFEIGDVQRNSQIQTGASIRLSQDIPDALGKGKRYVQYNRVAYRADYNLYIITNNTEDGLKILEQILPYFAPSISADIHECKDNSLVTSVKFTLSNTSKTDNWEGDLLSNRRRIVWTLSFDAQFYLHGPIVEEKIIKHTIIDVFANTDINAPDLPDEVPDIRAEAIVDPFEAIPPDPYTINEIYIDYSIASR
jgi:hypothetical protein